MMVSTPLLFGTILLTFLQSCFICLYADLHEHNNNKDPLLYKKHHTPQLIFLQITSERFYTASLLGTPILN